MSAASVKVSVLKGMGLSFGWLQKMQAAWKRIADLQRFRQPARFLAAVSLCSALDVLADGDTDVFAFFHMAHHCSGGRFYVLVRDLIAAGRLRESGFGSGSSGGKAAGLAAWAAVVVGLEQGSVHNVAQTFRFHRRTSAAGCRLRVLGCGRAAGSECKSGKGEY